MKNQFSAPIIINPHGALILERLPLSGSGTSAYDEDWLQELLFNHPRTLPINEIDQSYLNLVPVCRELNTPAGPVDVLYVTPEGKLVILEAKLWRNPEARRKVIGQILDYAKEIGSWTYEDLQREVARAVRNQQDQPRGLYDVVSSKYPETAEAEFIDSVSRSLKHGEFLLLIVGDGIREGVAAIADFLENHGTMHFTFGLVEMAIFKMEEGNFLVQPRVIAQSMIVKRTVITLETEGLVSKDASEMEEEASSELNESQKFYFDFWRELIDQLRLDDQSQPLPKVTKTGNIFFSMPSGSNAWITTYFSQRDKEVGLFLTFNRGALGDMIFSRLSEDKNAIDAELAMPILWKSADGEHTISVSKNFPDLKALQYRGQIKAWLAVCANRYVNVFRPRIERIISEA